jgi:hypothetical protein
MSTFWYLRGPLVLAGKRRNGVIFKSERKSIKQLLAGCVEEVKLWKLRPPKRDANLVDSWAGVFASAM